MHLERGSADSVSFVSPGCAERLQGHGLAPVPVTVGDTCSPISPPTPPFCCCCRPCAMQVREEAAPAQPPLPSCAVQVAGAAFLSSSVSPSTQHASVRRVSLRLSRAAVRPLLSCPCRQSCLTPVAAPPSRPGRGPLPACLCRRWECRPSGCVWGGRGTCWPWHAGRTRHAVLLSKHTWAGALELEAHKPGCVASPRAGRCRVLGGSSAEPAGVPGKGRPWPVDVCSPRVQCVLGLLSLFLFPRAKRKRTTWWRS